MQLATTTMKPSALNNVSERQVIVTFAILLLFFFMASSHVIAGTDITFASPTTLLTNWSTGSYGKMAALACLVVGLSIAIVKQSLMFVAGAVGLAIVAMQGPGIINGIVTATL